MTLRPLLLVLPFLFVAQPASAAGPDLDKSRAFIECRVAWDGTTPPLPEVNREQKPAALFVHYLPPAGLEVYGLPPEMILTAVEPNGTRNRSTLVRGTLEVIADVINTELGGDPLDIEPLYGTKVIHHQKAANGAPDKIYLIDEGQGMISINCQDAP